MLNSILKALGAFLAPLIAIMLPLQQALFVLLILILLNYYSQVVLCFKETTQAKNLLLRGIISIFSKTALTTLLKRLHEYSFAITIVGLFEVYILDIPIDLGDKTFSLIHFTIVVAGCLEVTRGFQLTEQITGNNMLEIIKNFIPEKLIELFKNKDSN